MLHRHRFHDTVDDSLLDLIPCDLGNCGIWIDHVIRNLHRSVISSFRGSGVASQGEALGKLAYLEGFCSVVDKREFEYKKRVNIESLRNAISAYYSSREIENSNIGQFKSYIISVLAIILPLVFVCLQMLQMPCIDGINYSKDFCAQKIQINPLMMRIAEFVLGKLHWIFFFSLCVMPMFIVGFRSKPGMFFRFENGGHLSDLKDLIYRSAISSKYFVLVVLILLLISVICSAIFVVYVFIGDLFPSSIFGFVKYFMR